MAGTRHLVAQLGTEGPMGRTVKDVALLLETQSGYDPRVPLAIATHEQFARALDGLDAKRARIGWLGDLRGYPPIEAGILDVCGQVWRASATSAARWAKRLSDTPPEKVWQAWLVWRRWLVAGLIAPLLAKPQNRALIKPEALWEYEQAQGLSGADVLAASVERTKFHRHLLALFAQHDFLALPAAQVMALHDATLRWPARIARSRDGHLPPLDGGDDLRHLCWAAVHQRASRFQRRGLTDGHAIDRQATGRSHGAATRARLRAERRMTCSSCRAAGLSQSHAVPYPRNVRQ